MRYAYKYNYNYFINIKYKYNFTLNTGLVNGTLRSLKNKPEYIKK